MPLLNGSVRARVSPAEIDVTERLSTLVPPQNLEAEESVLGAMLLSATAVGTVSEILGAADFYRESHAKAYRAALALWAKGEPVDAITLVDELDERGELEAVGGQARVAELAALVPSTSNVEHYARIVKEMSSSAVVRAGHEITRLGQERPGEVADLVDRAEQIVFELGQQRATSDFAHIEILLKESFERITQLYEAGAEITGIPAGFRELDLLTLRPAGEPRDPRRPTVDGEVGAGLCIAANLGVRHETPVALFTLEMSKSEVTQRMMCSEAKVESQRLRTGRLAPDDWPRLTTACDRLMKAPIYVDDSGSTTIMELRRRPVGSSPGTQPGPRRRRLPPAHDVGCERGKPRPGGFADLACAQVLSHASSTSRSSRCHSSHARSSSATTSVRSSPIFARAGRSNRIPISSSSSTATSTTSARSPTSRGSRKSSSRSIATARRAP